MQNFQHIRHSKAMGWIKVDKPHLTEPPRKLTSTEIERVVSSIHRIQSPFDKAADLAHMHLVNHVAKSLQEVEVAPSMIDALAKKLLISQVRNSCEPGYSMGSVTGSAMGSFNTQTMLNTFKSSGAADTGSKEAQASVNLVSGRPNPKTDYCTVHLKDKKTGLLGALELCLVIDQCTVKDVLSKGIDYELHDLPLAGETPAWVTCSMNSEFAQSMSKCPIVMELRMDPDEMAKRSIPMRELSRRWDWRWPGPGVALRSSDSQRNHGRGAHEQPARSDQFLRERFVQ